MDRLLFTAVVALFVSCAQAQDLTLEYNGMTISNNYLLDTNDFSGSLVCQTNQPGLTGIWLLPSGSEIDTVTRGNQSVSLNNLSATETGIYSCLFRNDGFTSDPVYVGIYNITEEGNNGSLVIESLSYSSPTLTCVSSGGPVSSVSWSGGTLSSTVTIVTDTIRGEYRHMVNLTNTDAAASGTYQCSVEHRLGSAMETIDLQLCDDGNIRLMENGFNTYTEICLLDVWVPLHTRLQALSNEGTPININLTPSHESITVNWSGDHSEYEVTCTDGVLTIRALVMAANTVDIAPLLASTNYTCCVLQLAEGPNGVFAVTGSGCSEVSTNAAPVLSLLEIILVAVAGTLALVIIVVFFGCCLLLCKHKKSRSSPAHKARGNQKALHGELERVLPEQKHYTKSRQKQGIAKITIKPEEVVIKNNEVIFRNKAATIEDSNQQKPAETSQEMDSEVQLIKFSQAEPSPAVRRYTDIPSPREKDTASKDRWSMNLTPHFSPQRYSAMPKPAIGPKPKPAAQSPVYEVPSRPTSADNQEADNPVYGERKPLHFEESDDEAAADNPIYGATGNNNEQSDDDSEEYYSEDEEEDSDDDAENPVYGDVDYGDDGEAENPMYGRTAMNLTNELLSQSGDEAENPVYGKVTH